MGIAIKMGTLGRCRAAHFWSNVDGFGDETIKGSMKKNRWKQIASNLSFAPRGAPPGWGEIKWLDEFLRRKCREACGITQNCSVDESMFKCLCKMCPWIQFMPNKPIKWGKYYSFPPSHTHNVTKPKPLSTGIKAFCLVLSTTYVYNWHIFRGKGDPLRGPNYMYRLIYNTLFDEDKWDNCNVTMFCDNAFTSIPLFRDLHDKRGIHAVGPCRKGKDAKNAGPHSWPHQKFKRNDAQYFHRGWDRVSYTKLSRGGWMQVGTPTRTHTTQISTPSSKCQPPLTLHTH